MADLPGAIYKMAVNTLNRQWPAIRRYPHGTERAGGFTLIELMITIAIVAVIAVFAVPAFSDFVLNNRIRGQSGDLMTQLGQARLEAIRTASRVTVCPGGISKEDDPICDGTAWENGWVIFFDTNANHKDNSGEKPFAVSGVLDGGNTLRSIGFTTYISFRHDGSSADDDSLKDCNSDLDLRFCFVLCDSRGFGDKARAIVINGAGRIKVLEASASGSSVSNCGT